MKQKLAAIFICLGIIALSANAQREITLNIGDEAPKLVVERWVKGEPIREFKKDHVYVLDFWATWCVPCKEGMPHMSELARKYKGKASFIAMDVSEPERPGRDVFVMVNEFVRKMGNKMDLHVAMDTKDAVANQSWLKAAGLGGLPSAFIVDQKGKIAWMGQPREIDSSLAAVIAGTFDSQAFAKLRASRNNPRQATDETQMAVINAIQKAITTKDYKLAISLYEKSVASNPGYAGMLRNNYYRALAHVDADKAYRQVMAVKGTAGEYDLARTLSEEEGLDKKIYNYLIDFFTRRSENDFFAMGKVAKAHFYSGDIEKAIDVQRKFVEDQKLPTTPSTDGYIKREEEVLKKYIAARPANTTVYAKLDDLQEGTFVYLSAMISSAKKDSVVAGKGEFKFNLNLEKGDSYVLRIGKTAGAPGALAIIYLQPGTLNIKAKGPLLTQPEFSGSAYANEFEDLHRFIRKASALSDMSKVSEAMNEASRNKDSVKGAELRKNYRVLDSIRTELYKQWIARHRASPVSAFALSLYVRERDMDVLQEQINALKPEARKNALVERMQFSIDAAKATAIGKVAPDFIQNDTLGKPVALKDFRGKYVLVDFWASWCVPCRAENPHVVKAFNKFKEKGFTVLGISLDKPDAKDKWLKAIHDDALTWTHLSDLKYWDNEVSNQYDIKSIPANLLISPDGIILAKNLRGEELEKKLGEVIK